MRTKNTHTTFFILFMYLFCFQTPLTNIWGIFRYWDEFFAVLCLCAFVIYSLKYLMPLKREVMILTLFLAVGFLGALINQYQDFLRAVLPDAFLCMKFWIVFYCGKYVVSILADESDAKYRIGKHACFMLFVLSTLSVLNYCTSIFPSSSFRFGIKALELFYNHPTNLVAILVYLLSIIVWTSDEIGHWRLYVILDLVMMALTCRSKAFVTICIVALLFYFIRIRNRRVTGRTLLLFVPLVVLIAWDQIQYYFVELSESSARLALLTTAVQIAKDYFPIGVGFAAFGSTYSAEFYSPIYALYGINNIYGLRISNTSFISDSFWPMILGQTGIIGLLCIIYVLFKMLKDIQKIRHYQNEYLAALLVFCYFLVSSTSEAAFVSPNTIPLAFILSILLYQEQSKLQEDDVYGYE